MRPLHGPGYEHLDCSACLTVSRALFERLNGTLSENPSTYLASHRLNRANQLKRLPYRNSELLVTEVMDNFCRSYQNDERTLRLHPKSKVRLYHQQAWRDAKLAVRPSLREEETFPDGAHDPEWDDYVPLRRYQIAKVYSPKDQEALQGLAMLGATPAMCATLVEEFEDEIEDLVKLAHNVSDIEYGLCGMPLPEDGEDAEAAAAARAEVMAAIRPITNICARTAVLREAARQDQLRWAQYARREARRLAKLADKEKLVEATQDAKAEEASIGSPLVDAEHGDVSSAEAVQSNVEEKEDPQKYETAATHAPSHEEAAKRSADADEGDL